MSHNSMDREIALLEKQARIASSPKVKRVKAITDKILVEKEMIWYRTRNIASL